MRLLVYIAILIFTLAAQARDVSQSDTLSGSGFSIQKIEVIGKDSRKSPEAFPKAPKNERYRAVGAILCKDATFAQTGKYVRLGTGTLVENQRTVVTAIHTFVDETGKLVTAKENCTFNIMGDKGEFLQSIPLIEVTSLKDSSKANISGPKTKQNDWALLTLSEDVKNVVPFKIERNQQLSVTSKIQLCAFSHDLSDSENPNGNTIKRCLTGTYRNNGLDKEAYQNSMLLIHDIDTNGMSSGAPIFVEKDVPTIQAIHVGGRCAPGYSDYDVNLCSNSGIFFTKVFYDALEYTLGLTGGSIYGPAKVQKTKFITPVPANPNREVST